ncbi:MAG: HEAT repeat domain-containing protein [Isosphaeraceae bacterium]
MSRSKIRGATFATIALTLALLAARPTYAQTPSPAQKEREARFLAVLAKPDATRQDRSEACRELALVATRDAVAPLAKLLADPELAHMGRYALEPIPDPAVDAALRDAVGKVKGRLLVGVIGSLGVRRDASAVGLLTPCLADSDSEVASAAARALGKIGTPEAAKAIETALSNAPASNVGPLAEGLFRCADALAAHEHRGEAVALLDRLSDPKFPPQVRTGAQAKARLLKVEQAKGL